MPEEKPAFKPQRLKPVFQWQPRTNLPPVPIRSPETIERERREAERKAQKLAKMPPREPWQRWWEPPQRNWKALSSRRKKKEIRRVKRETAFAEKAAAFAREFKEATKERELTTSERSIDERLTRLFAEQESLYRVGERRPAPAVYWLIGRVLTDHDYIVAMFASYSQARYRLL